MDEEAVQKRLREQRVAQAKLGQRKNANKARTQKSAVNEELQDERINDPSRAIEIVADAIFEDPDHIPPPNKKQKNHALRVLPSAPKHILESAPLSSIALGRDIGSSSILHLCEADEEKLSTMNSVSRGEEVMALASQLLLWSREQVVASKDDLDQISKLEKAVDAAKNKAKIEQQKAVAAEAKLKKIGADAAVREAQLMEKISNLEKELEEAKQDKLDVEANYYGRGLDKRLEMVKQAQMDFTKCMFDYELDIWKKEQANDALQSSDIEAPILNAEDDAASQENLGEN